MSKAKKVTFQISGMHCNGCATSIGRALSRQEGIEHAEASYDKGTAEVKFDEKQIKKEKMVSIIEDLGYKVEGEI